MAGLENGVPYLGEGVTLDLNKEVNYGQLADELGSHVPDGVNFVGVRSEGKDHLTLHFSQDFGDLTAIQQVVDAHVPDEQYGMTPEQIEYEELKGKLGSNNLTVGDLNKLLKHALLQGKL